MNTIILTGADLVTSSAAEEARGQRDALLHQAHHLPLIVDAATAAKATDALRQLREFYKVIEEGRVAAQAPVLELQRKIQSLAGELRDQVKVEGERIGKLLGAYNAEQERLEGERREAARREEQRIRDEAARKEREAAEEQRKKDKAAQDELARQQKVIADEAAAKAARARTEAGRERAEKEAEQRKKDLEEQARRDKEDRDRAAAVEQQKRDDEEVRRVAANREAAAVAVAKPKGTSTSEKIEYKIENITALYEAAPYLVNLTENVAALKNALKHLQPGQNLPGVKHWTESVTITRASRA